MAEGWRPQNLPSAIVRGACAPCVGLLPPAHAAGLVTGTAIARCSRMLAPASDFVAPTTRMCEGKSTKATPGSKGLLTGMLITVGERSGQERRLGVRCRAFPQPRQLRIAQNVLQSQATPVPFIANQGPMSFYFKKIRCQD